MLSTVIKRALVFFAPASILIATWLLAPKISGLTDSRLELMVLSPYLVIMLGMFMAVHFHRCRPFLILLFLAIFYWGSRTYLIGKSFEPGLNPVYQFFVLLIPLNMALVALMRERGFVTTAGRLRFAFLTLQGFGVYWLFKNHFIDLVPYIARSYIHFKQINTLFIPQTALFVGLFCLILTAAIAVRRQTPIDAGILGALVAFLISCNWLTNSNFHIAFSASGAVIVTFSILRDSYNMAFRDDLTGLPSRRSLNESLQGVGRKYCLAMLDVDHFKKFNDTYGHDVGDQVLKMVARKMMDVGGGGKAYRYGGEEFTILFTGRSASDAIPHLEEVRKTIAGYQLALRGEERPKKQQEGKELRGNRRSGSFASVTISIGVAERSESLSTIDEVMKAADKALYKAKSKGRNQVYC